MALEHLITAGWEITLVCAWEPDDEVAQRVQTRLGIRSIEHWHEDHELALREMTRFDAVLSEKLHVAVVAACRGVPFVALGYRSKVMDFCRSIGWQEFCLSTADADPDRIVELIGRIADDPVSQASRLGHQVLVTKERLLRAATVVVAKLTP